MLLSVLLCLTAWVNIFCFWANPPADGKYLGAFDDDDMMMQASLLFIGTAMVAFHMTFEWLYWRETQCVMPAGADGNVPLDPREDGHGIPHRYSWFGLPSMWFTSQQAYDDLRLWIMHSRFDYDLVKYKIYPEEMALLALDPDGASYVRKTLASSKL